MKPTEIYLMRHGQSTGNLQDLFVGQTEAELTELGLKQAEITADYFENVHIDAIYSSDLSRAYHTALATARKKNLPVIPEPGLREIAAGLWEQQPYYGLAEISPEAFRIWLENFGHAYSPEGETVLETQQRLDRTIRKLAEANLGKTICLFTHAVALRAVTAGWIGLTSDTMQQHPYPSNASVTHAIYQNGEITLLEYSRDDFMGDHATRLPENRNLSLEESK